MGSSPRTRGCFFSAPVTELSGCVFPAHAGVFLNWPKMQPAWVSLPRARGGVSKLVYDFAQFMASSPRTRGCFCKRALEYRNQSVFPAHAGVFLPLDTWGHRCRRLPRARGGVSIGASFAAWK
jgi:hypothetical protein